MNPNFDSIEQEALLNLQESFSKLSRLYLETLRKDRECKSKEIECKNKEMGCKDKEMECKTQEIVTLQTIYRDVIYEISDFVSDLSFRIEANENHQLTMADIDDCIQNNFSGKLQEDLLFHVRNK